MIRPRQFQLDDPFIYHLIENELVPLSHLSADEINSILKDIPRRLNRGITFVTCPNHPEQAVGFIHAMLHGELLYIDMLAVLRSEQRKHHGHHLLEYAEQFARTRGCQRAKVLVDEGNQQALRFYRKSGYTVHKFIDLTRCYELRKTL
ncbi:GNAT family N-acetyltransferase [Paenibacillus sp. JX-17]|uniref:GNAT family N-acetyltransferase n=1 Tax=Paenibacillus lacisoli TaxID=3064525 RepID=A0ABT9CDX2_9BACL|nr:GNAT family N-acetyltransferase [Paenibacillus sp. JX-17]MDO7907426.1 GNAT family N-acetyltransferase [Paenibacillus sp. JX-17]